MYFYSFVSQIDQPHFEGSIWECDQMHAIYFDFMCTTYQAVEWMLSEIFRQWQNTTSNGWVNLNLFNYLVKIALNFWVSVCKI